MSLVGTNTERYPATITSVRDITGDIKLYTFCRDDGAAWPQASAGAHVDFCLPNGLIRQYSLVLKDSDVSTYSVAVKNDPASRGGSKAIFDTFAPATKFEVVGPRNHFPLAEEAAHTTLIAGGIGITPILSMAYRLRELGRPFSFYYACRTAEHVPFRDALEALSATIHIDDERGSVLDLGQIAARAPANGHLYCCGPLPMMDAFKKAVRGWPPGNTHTEFFSSDIPVATEGGFSIELARSKKTLFVNAGQRIVDVLTSNGINVSMSCEQGICGSCETRVLSGVPDHRDEVLSEQERKDNKTMMICCSGSHSDVLVLDI